jgi:hypothetical protein
MHLSGDELYRYYRYHQLVLGGADRPDVGEASGGGTGADGRRIRGRGWSWGRRGGCGGYSGEVRSGGGGVVLQEVEKNEKAEWAGGPLLPWLDHGPTAEVFFLTKTAAPRQPAGSQGSEMQSLYRWSSVSCSFCQGQGTTYPPLKLEKMWPAYV